jgi:hypothetical protein
MSAMSDKDFNGADAQDAAFDLIPANTFAKVRLTIRPGGAGPEGWADPEKEQHRPLPRYRGGHLGWLACAPARLHAH